VLSTAYKFGLEHGKVMRRPVIHLLKEAKPRQGFFEEHQFQSVRIHLPVGLQVAVTIMWLYRWRRGKVMSLQLSQIDLDAGTTNNRVGRVAYMSPELKTLITAQIGQVNAISRRLERVLPQLFVHLHSCYTGQPVYDF